MYTRSAAFYDAIYSFKDYRGEAARVRELIEAHRPGADTLLDVAAVFVDEPELKVARVNTSEREGDLAVMDMHYVVGTPERVEHFVERLELGLFTHEEYLAAFRDAGLDVEHDTEGLMGRGLYIGLASA